MKLSYKKKSFSKFLSIAILATSALSLQVNASEWTGSHVGISAESLESNSNFFDTTIFNSRTDNKKEALGVTAGYRHQIDNLVVGVSAGISFGEQEKEANFTGVGANTYATEKLTNAKSLSLELGYAFEKFLPYLSVGRMQIDQDVTTSIIATRAVNGSFNETRDATVYGAGINYLISENKILSVDYSQADFGTLRRAYAPFVSGVIESDLEIEMIKITYSFKF